MKYILQFIEAFYNRLNKPKGDGINEPIIKNVMRCGICESPADRWAYMFRCSKNPGHIADLNTGIFSNCDRHSYERYRNR